jgi:hypothetical protein
MIRIATALLTLTLLGCPGSRTGVRQESADDFAANVERDLVALIAHVEAIADEAALREAGQRDQGETCEPIASSCELCWQLDGTSLSGTLTASADPCSATVSVRSLSAAWALESASITGTWAPQTALGAVAGNYAIALQGTLESTLTVTGRAISTIYDSTWTGDVAATTEGYEVASFTATLTYAAWDGQFDVVFAWDGTQWSGTATGDSVTCTAGGTSADDVAVSCSAA